MGAPDFWIIAGPNGAGKTTLVSRGQFAGVVPLENLVNPDDITLEYLKSEGIERWADAPLEDQKRLFVKAADEAQRRLEERIETGSVGLVESVLSTPKYCPLVERTLQLGGRFFLIYVLLNSPDLSKKRVAARFQQGGHDVPADKLERRWQDSLKLLPWFAARAHLFWVVDNSNAEKGLDPVLLVSGESRLLTVHGVPVADVRQIVSDVVSGIMAEDTVKPWRLDLEDSFTRPDT